MWAYFILFLITPFACTAMEPEPMGIELPPSVMLYDINNKHIATLNPQEYEILKKLNPALRTTPKTPSGGLIVPYVVATGLTEAQIKSLAQSLKNQNNFYNAVNEGLLDINITPGELEEVDNQLKELDLIPVGNLLIIRTQDNYLVPLEKNIATKYFKTISDLVEDLSTTLAVPVNLKQETLRLIYGFVKALSDVSGTEIAETANKFIKDNNITVQTLLNLMVVSEYLGLEDIYIANLFENYKRYITTTDAWQQHMKIPIFNKMAQATRELRFLKEKSSVKQVNGIWIGIIEGAEVNTLKWINVINDIDKCEIVFIHNTNIDKVEKNTLELLPKIKKLAFISNKKLTTLEEDCLKSPTLEWLLFFGNNITELPVRVFDLPNLKNLLFAHNKLQVIKASWGIKLPNLTNFYLIEPNLNIFELGWLNGLGSMKLFFYKEGYYLSNFLGALQKGLLPGQKLEIYRIDHQKMGIFFQLLEIRTTEPIIFTDVLRQTSETKIITG